MAFILSPNMQLPVPAVGTQPGPDFAFNINQALTLLDQHDHSPGKGVQITPSGLNINSTLSLNGNFLTDVAGVTLSAQSSPPAVNTLYESGIDLFFVDGLGNNIRITQSGGVAGTPGSISNLVPPASASYVAGSKTFVWQSGTNLAANMDAASYIFRNISPNSTFGITVQPPAALSSNWSLTLPAIPVATSFMQLDTSGVISASIPISGGLTAANIAAGTQIPIPIQTVTTTDTIALTSGLVLASTAAAYTLTSYTAIGNAGKMVRIKKTTNDFNVLTVSLVGTSTYSTTLNTQNEQIIIISDGTDWIIDERTMPSEWQSATFTFSAGFGTTTNQSSWIKRVGDSLECRIFANAGTVAATGATVTPPTGISIDNAKISANTQQIVGEWYSNKALTYGGNSLLGPVAADNGTNTVILAQSGNGGTAVTVNVSAIIPSTGGFNLKFTIPVSGWNG